MRDNYYRDMKFSERNKEQESLLLCAINAGGLQVSMGVTKRQFRNFFVAQVLSSFSRLQGNSQTLCQKNWRDKKIKFD